MDILQKWHRTRDKTSYFVRWEGDHRPLAKTAKVMHKGKRGCCTASSFFMLQPSFHASQNPRLKSRVPKMCPKSCFSPKNGDRKGFVEISTKPYFSMAERVGFEPTVAHHHTWFRVKHLRPLGHLSMPLCDKSHYIIGASAWQGIFLHWVPGANCKVHCKFNCRKFSLNF